MTANKLEYFFNPSSIAVIGASREEDKPGHIIFRNLVENMRKNILKARIYPVNPKANELLGFKVFHSLNEIKENIDLAIIVIPAKYVPSVLEECGEKHVKASIIISAGFSEIGNKDLELQVLDIAKKHGIRIIGPNCIGVLSPWSGIDTIFLPVYKKLRDGKSIVSTPRPLPGYITLISQSGAFGTVAMDYMYGEGIGLSTFVSYGNKIDVDETDLLEYFMEDEYTHVVLMYIESIEKGRKFIEIAQKVSRLKPIIVLKAGITAAGSRAAASHTAAIAGVDSVYNAAFRKSGVIRVYDLEELFDSAKALLMLPPAKGNRAAIVTDGGGAGVMATDMAELIGLSVPRIKDNLRNELDQLRKDKRIPYFSSIENPIDLTGSATTEMYVEVLDVLLRSDDIDIIVVLALHQVPRIEDPIELAKKLSEKVKEYGFNKPVLAVDTGYSEAAVLERELFDKHSIPSYTTPERAIKASRSLYLYGKYLTKVGMFDKYLSIFYKRHKNIIGH